MKPEVYIGLVHHPVLDKESRVITTAVTNMDLHDLARLARTYDLAGYFVIQPLELQARLVRRLIGYWLDGKGAEYNITRQQAFERVSLVRDLGEATKFVEEKNGERPRVVATSARKHEGAGDYGEVRSLMEEGGAWLVLFGTGWGIEPGFIAENADYLLAPIEAASDYNHLSVRTAAAIVLDRLLGEYS